jgi:hypothetical protein
VENIGYSALLPNRNPDFIMDTPIDEAIPEDVLAKSLAEYPFVSLPGSLNLRDAGHPPMLRSRLLYRSGTLSFLSEGVRLQLVKDYNVKRIIDLRSEIEIGDAEVYQKETAQWTTIGIERTSIPGEGPIRPFDLAPFIQDEGNQGWKDEYAEMVERFKPAVRQVVEHLANHSNEALMVHCTAGKDRTSVVISIILLLAGVPEKDIVRDHVLSRIGIEPHRELLTKAMLKWMPAAYKKADTAVETPKDLHSVAGLFNWASIRPGAMEAFLSWFHSVYPEVESYLRACGLVEDTWVRAKQSMKTDAVYEHGDS